MGVAERHGHCPPSIETRCRAWGRACRLGGAGFLAAAVVAWALSRAAGAEATEAWKSDWATKEGFALEADSSGYRYPSAIAFVPSPGDAPDDPLYFVTELEGAIKVVTNDRSVHLFARTEFAIPPPTGLPESEGEVGQASLCLDPERGFVFATFSYRDEGGVLRNGIVGYETAPERFALEPRARLDIVQPFLGDVSAFSHQVGGCAVDGDHLYVGVGDGRAIDKARSLESTLGKILRMKLDGSPVPSNPFFTDDGEDTARDFIWAYGLRNPFGLEVVNGRLFVVDNGPTVDRLVEIRPGGDYFWTGSNWSIAVRAEMAFAPAIGPAQLDHVAGGEGVAEELGRSFLIASAGAPSREGPGSGGEKSVIRVPYDLERTEVAAEPEVLVSYRGDANQSIVGVGLGPDGIYYVPLFPDSDGETRVYRLFLDPERAHPHVSGRGTPLEVMGHYGCRACHTMGLEQIGAGPSLHPAVLFESVRERLDALSENGHAGSPEVDRILALDGLARVRAWVARHLQEPGFDTGSSAMPDLGVGPGEAEMIARYLVPDVTFADRVKQIIGPIGVRKLAAAMTVAFLTGVGLTMLVVWLIRRRLAATGILTDGIRRSRSHTSPRTS